MSKLPPLSGIHRVTFYKRDEITTDLICCEVDTGGDVYRAHEEMPHWAALLEHIADLPGFRSGWFENVSQPPFEHSEFVAFERA